MVAKSERHGISCGVPCVPQEYCLNKEQLEFVLDVTSFKTPNAWGGDPLLGVPPPVKASLTRYGRYRAVP